MHFISLRIPHSLPHPLDSSFVHLYLSPFSIPVPRVRPYLAFQKTSAALVPTRSTDGICVFMNGTWSRQVHLKPRALVQASRERRTTEVAVGRRVADGFRRIHKRMQSKNHDLRQPPLRPTTPYSLLAALSSPSPYPSILLPHRVPEQPRFMHSSCSPPSRVILLFLYCIVSLVPEVTTHYHTRRHGASASLNCFPSLAKEGGGGGRRDKGGHPVGTVLADDRPLKCENEHRRVFPLFAREFRKRERQ